MLLSCNCTTRKDTKNLTKIFQSDILTLHLQHYHLSDELVHGRGMLCMSSVRAAIKRHGTHVSRLP
jgi:hypothetical protein